ncbi:MAG TPA: hypothetical protein VFQ92_24075 [Blastocatellia bacterium]|nr:hypothetical protein [Blastocatellia bacterium]
MFLIKTKAATALILTLALATVTFGQQSQPTPRPAEAAPAPVDNTVDTQGFKGKIFEVKHRDPAAIMRAVSNLGSGFKGSTISYNQDFKTITVRDFPENIAAIEEAIKRLDAPQATAPDIEFRMHLLIASNAEGATSQFPSDLGDVIKQLQSTLNYKSYHLLTSIVQRVKEGNGLSGSGVAQVKPPIVGETADARYSYAINFISLAPSSSGASTIQVRRLSFNVNGNEYHAPLGQASLNTELGMRDGEKVVVGTASLRDKAMVLVLTARVIK